MFLKLDLYCKDPAQPLITAGWHLDDLDRDLSDLPVRRVKGRSCRGSIRERAAR